MKWYEMLIAIPLIIIGAYIRGKIYEHKKNMHHNNSWRSRIKKWIVTLSLYISIKNCGDRFSKLFKKTDKYNLAKLKSKSMPVYKTLNAV